LGIKGSVADIVVDAMVVVKQIQYLHLIENITLSDYHSTTLVVEAF